MSKKKRIFIGSSAEALQVAEVLQSQLQYNFDVTIWNQDVFTPGVSGFESIDEAVRASTYGVFVFAADDAMVTRGIHGYAPRMNVVFEMGYFAGTHGMRRTFVLEPKDSTVHKLSDLAGITTIQFDPDRFKAEPGPAIGPAVHAIKTAIAKDRVSFPPSHLGRLNLLDESIKVIEAIPPKVGEEKYCLAANLSTGRSVKVTIRAEFGAVLDHEKGSAWTYPISPLALWERQGLIVDGQQSLLARGPGTAFTIVHFKDFVKSFILDVFEDEATVPTFTKAITVNKVS